jgi:hypothetical protein
MDYASNLGYICPFGRLIISYIYTKCCDWSLLVIGSTFGFNGPYSRINIRDNSRDGGPPCIGLFQFQWMNKWVSLVSTEVTVVATGIVRAFQQEGCVDRFLLEKPMLASSFLYQMKIHVFLMTGGSLWDVGLFAKFYMTGQVFSSSSRNMNVWTPLAIGYTCFFTSITPQREGTLYHLCV